MPAARAAVRAPAPPPPPAPAKRLARTKQGSPTPAAGEADALADQLGRVLKVSQPKAPSKPRIPASTKSAASTTTTASTRTAATSSRTATTAATSRVTSRPTTTTSSDKGKAKAPDGSSNMPDWAEEKSPLRTGDRARLAMAALNESLKSLTEAYQAGYRHGQGQGQPTKSSLAKTPTTSGSTSGRTADPSHPGHDQWDAKRVQSVMSMCETALRVLRDMNDKGALGGKGVEVERAAQGFVAKCLHLGMFRKALELLCEARPRILKLYNPAVPTPVAPQAKTGSTEQKRTQSGTAVSRSRPQPIASSSRIPSTVSAKPLPTSWTELALFPSPTTEEELSEVLKMIMFQAMMAAWISLVALAVEYEVPIPKLLPLPISDTTDPERLHPFRLALGLPRQIVTPLSHMFYRHISAASHSDPFDWSHAKRLGLAALAIGVEITPDDAAGKVTPSSIWDLSHRIVSDRVSKSNQARTLEEGEEIIAWLVGWAETAISERKEERSKWFDGKAWLALMDLWIGLARRLNKSDIIDKALSYMTASTSLGPSTPKSSTPPASLMSRPSERSLNSKRGMKKPEEQVVKMCGDLARINIYPNSDPIVFAAAESSLRSTDLEALSEALASLPNNEDGQACLSKAVRGVERVRRGCVQAVETATKQDPAYSFVSAAVQWLTSSIELVEDVLQNVDVDLGSSAFDLVAGAIASLTTLARLPLPGLSESSHILAHLDRGIRLCRVSLGRTASADRADWLRCLSVVAFNHGAKLWKAGKAADAARFASSSCEYAEAALRLSEESSEDASDTDLVAIKAVREQLSKRYELLAACHQKCGDTKAACNALAAAIASLPASILEAFSESLASLPLAAAFRLQGDLDALLVRLSLLIISDPAVIRDDVRRLVSPMESKGYKPDIVAGILERLVTLLEEGAHKPEVAAVMLEVGESCLTVASARETPVRRLRITMRLMAVIVGSGQRPERFDALSDEASQLVSAENLGVDTALAPYRCEYHAAILLIRALRAYHTESEAATSVSQLGAQALEQLRHLGLPPPAQDLPASPKPVDQPKKRAPAKTAVPKTPARTGRAVKTPARRVSDPKLQPKTPAPKMRKELSAPAKRRSSLPTANSFDDLDKLTGYIGSLASLLGLMGLVLAKVDALKIMRALLRHREDLVDDFVRSSGILATEYCKLGKQSRAGTVFQQAMRCVKESQRHLGETVKAELHLRYSAYLAQNERVEEATEEYREAMNVSKEIQPLKTASLTTRVLEKSSQLERAALARIALSHICVAQRQTSASILHLSGAFRLCSRAADTICRIASTETKGSPTSKDSDDPFSAPSLRTLVGQDEPAKDDAQAANRQVSVFTGKYLSSLQWHAAENLLSATFDLAAAFAQRGSVRDCEYFLKQAGTVASAVKSGVMQSRAEARSAELEYRLRKYEASVQRLGEASNGLTSSIGPDAIDIKRIQGDVFSRQEMIEEAGQIFEITTKELVGLDEAFVATEALVPSPRKVVTANNVKEPLLPSALAHVLGQQAWLYREAGFKDDSDALMTELAKLAASAASRAEEMYLQGRIGLHEALEQFKADLFMSSLTESTIAMPMGLPAKRPSERLSSRIKIQNVLERAEFAFRSALELFTDGAPVEVVRQARLNLALLHAFQTSLQHGSDTVTAAAADILASNASMTFHRERLEAIDCKFAEVDHDDLKWPSVSDIGPSMVPLEHDSDTDVEDDQLQFRTYWGSIKSRHVAAHSIPTEPLDLSSVPRIGP
ncbi:hypothetical protein EHS25_000693 [Saitozyma podzolica]|uniref:Separase n=1 Tax=Saitozyma podzolica TaxID=1890683 RepID=A0A427YX20_9TREE|nr:hypothetical protein EHS25_000693 [Saitozyma podzolica]